jgi:hypothetical protein
MPREAGGDGMNAVVILSRTRIQRVESSLSPEVAMRIAMDHDIAHPEDVVSVIDLTRDGATVWNNQQFFKPISGGQGKAGSHAA